MSRNTKVNRRRLLEIAAGLSAGLLAAACAPAAAPATAPPAAPSGATPAAKPAAAPTPATKAPAAKAPLAKVTVVSTGGILENAHWMVGKEKGFFEEFGIDFQYMGVSGGKTQLDALMGSSADLVDSSPGPTLAAIEQGAALKVVATSRPRLSYAFFAQKSISSLKDLEGQVVGSGPANAFNQNVTRALFEKVGVDSAKVEFANIGTSADIYRALTARKVVAGVSGINYIPSADGDGLKVLAEMWKELPDYVTWSFISSDQVLKEKGDQLARVLAGYAKTYRFTKSPESKDLFMKAGIDELKAKPDEVEAYWNFCKNDGALATNLELTPKQLEYMQQLNISAGGTQSKILPFEQVADLSVRDKALALLKG